MQIPPEQGSHAMGARKDSRGSSPGFTGLKSADDLVSPVYPRKDNIGALTLGQCSVVRKSFLLESVVRACYDVIVARGSRDCLVDRLIDAAVRLGDEFQPGTVGGPRCQHIGGAVAGECIG